MADSSQAPKGRAWTVRGTRTVFRADPFVRVERQTVALPDGRVIDDYYRLTLGDFACVYPVTADGLVVVLRQYCHGPERVALAFPGGACDPGEDAAATARRELLEETGYAAGTLRPLARAVVDSNKRCGVAHLFLALDCASAARPGSGDLEQADILLLTPGELAGRAARGEMAGLAHLSLLALATHPAWATASPVP